MAKLPRTASTPLRVGIWIFAIGILAAIYGYGAEEVENSRQTRLGRHLLSTANDTSDPSIIDYPLGAKNGGVVLYILGVLYMFLALAIICDEYFVPALEELMKRTGVSDDVGGATFMAAGGSAPELFTSLIGTFSESSVGFGTIVGSAVFNVLFVIGMCALFSKELLTLTWWPLARDVSYYALSLVVLAAFFNDKVIEFWEALVLFLMYGGYVFLMAKNQALHAWVISRAASPSPVEVGKIEVELESGGTTPAAQSNPSINAFTKIEKSAIPQVSAFLQPRSFRAGVFQLLVRDAGMGAMDKVRFMFVNNEQGSADEKFDLIDTDNSGDISHKEFETLLRALVPTITEEEVQAATDEIDKNHDHKISREEFTKWYADSQLKLAATQAAIFAEVEVVFKEIDSDNSGTIDRSEVEALMMKVNPDFKSESAEAKKATLDAVWTEAKHADSATITHQEFLNWFKGSMVLKKQLSQQGLAAEGTEEEEAGLSLEWPSDGSALNKICFIILLPLVAALHFTVPDVRQKGQAAKYPFAFVLSIFWIGVASFFMVEWSGIIGEYAGIPIYVMGMTFLAAGTSVPDLLTSVIVARQGLGDMAVSSSIGSNIFDVLVGLPLPWLLYSISKGFGPVRVEADTLFMSILVLFFMLILVISTIAANGWQMTKTLGITMFVLYFIFLLQDLLRYYEYIPKYFVTN